MSISGRWKAKGPVRNNSIKQFNTFQRLFVPADNVERKAEDGCMKKIKIERCIKLREEDFKNRGRYDLVSGKDCPDKIWIDSFGKQARDAGMKMSHSTKYNDGNMRNHWAKTLKMK